MAAGCVVIASEVVGVQEMIHHNIDGLLAAANSPESLANALQLALTESYFSERLSS